MTVHKIGLALAWVGLALVAATALPQDVRAQNAQTVQNTGALMDRIDRLERDIRTLNQQIARSAAPSASPATGQTPAASTSGGEPPVQFNASEGMMSRVMVRLGALESEVRAATGQSENLSFRIDQLTQRLDKLLVDLDYRLARLEAGAPGGPLAQPGAQPGAMPARPGISAAPAPMGVSKVGAMPPVGDTPSDGVAQGTMRKDGTYLPSPEERNTLGVVSRSTLDAIVSKGGEEAGADGAAPAPMESAAMQAPSVAPSLPAGSPAAEPAAALASILPEGSVQDRYRFAFDLTRQARYDEAEIAFKAFLDAHGEDDLANNARYWLAETFYVRKRFMDAAQAFFEAYQKAPEGPKAADSLLKLGMSMAGLNKSTEACATFGKLRKEFTPLKPNIEQALNREVKRLECK